MLNAKSVFSKCFMNICGRNSEGNIVRNMNETKSHSGLFFFLFQWSFLMSTLPLPAHTTHWALPPSPQATGRTSLSCPFHLRNSIIPRLPLLIIIQPEEMDAGGKLCGLYWITSSLTISRTLLTALSQLQRRLWHLWMPCSMARDYSSVHESLSAKTTVVPHSHWQN